MRSHLCLSLLALLSRSTARPQGCRANALQGNKAIYFITNDESNGVASIPIRADGTLSGGTVTETGGKGSNSIDGSTNKPAKPDALVSQSALTIAGQNIFAVNAGSNTVSMLSISTSDPTKLTMVGQPATVPAEFPNTVAASAKNKLVCVGATGAVAGVSCANFDANGIGKMDALRSFSLKQKTPPVGPTNTVSQVFFSEDESMLLVTVKGDPAANNTGFLSAFPVDCSQRPGEPMTVSQHDERSSPKGTAVLFGSQSIPGTSNIFATDASFGAAVIAVDKDTGAGSLVSKQAVDGQAATCWAAISKARNSAFVTDVAVPRVVEMSLDDASIRGQLDVAEAGVSGLIDLKAAGNRLYGLAPGNDSADAQVLVMEAASGKDLKLKQCFGLGDLGAGANSQGMAIL